MSSERPFYGRKRFIIPLVLLLSLAVMLIWYMAATSVSPPRIWNTEAIGYRVTQPDQGFYSCNGSWIQHSTSGLWEMYIQGSPFDRGVVNGKLTAGLIREQEEAFVDQIRKMVPSPSYLNFLKYFIYWFNRDLDRNIPEEYLEEIYGVSLSASDQFDFIGTPYHRMMNYHSAHDIGHALQDLALVGCTSFGVWDSRSADSSLIIGRNFDFYMGDEFAKNKIVCFEKPDSGYAFMMVTWAGMIGTVSGMNLEGLTVTINAAKSEIPWSARTPISIVAREILQYARTIREAYTIAERRQTFVSESILIGSAFENRAAIIEKSPGKIDLVESDRDEIICSNHYQGEAFADDPLNIKNMKESPSLYRYRRMEQLLGASGRIDPVKAAAILRDRMGLGGRDIGMGNEKAVNQLIAHHSVIFMPEKRQAWVSAGPWQAGSYICYDLNKIFHTFATLHQRTEIEERRLNIPADTFLGTTDYIKFLRYKEMRDSVQTWLKTKDYADWHRSFTDEFVSLNPLYFEGYMLAGDLAAMEGDDPAAALYYGEALRCEIPWTTTRSEITGKLGKTIVRTKEKQK